MEYTNIFLQDIVPDIYRNEFKINNDNSISINRDISEEKKSKIINIVLDNSIRYYNNKEIWIFDYIETNGIFINPYFFTKPKRS